MKRFKIVQAIAIFFLAIAFLLRFVLTIWQFSDIDSSIWSILKTFAYGLFFDLGVLSFFMFVLGFYLASFPRRWIGGKLDKAIVYGTTFLVVLILVFTFFAEITFWEEFRCRFNFIAVDYLVYTYEVVQNIHESYPLYLLIPGVFITTGFIVFLFHKSGAFETTFSSKEPIINRLMPYSIVVLVMLFFSFFIKNADAEWSKNRYNSELSKSGIYAFFAAMRNNQMDFKVFYQSEDDQVAFDLVKEKLSTTHTEFSTDKLSIRRVIVNDSSPMIKPNVVLILMESMSASFMKEYGNQENITPYLDELAQNSISFTNLFATGTRTVRGMEAMTLSIPPTPGSSIVKRLDNQNLYTMASVFNTKKYESNFFYGGDGYFDNMNAFFGGNGFNIYDRGRGSVLSDAIATTRNDIEDDEVTFENAWGICDEDIYAKMIQAADKDFSKNKPFFNFIMTTSNHKPYSYPEGKIDIPSGSGRSGAVKYADYALGKFMKVAETKPWFKNTVFVIIADHCASSAGKDEIDVANYHIPAFIYSPLLEKQKVTKLCSQIDLMPTLFSLLHWNYTSNFFGRNVLSSQFNERAFIGTYLKLGVLKEDKIMVLSNQKKNAYYKWNRNTNDLILLPMDAKFLKETISWYQTADYMYVNHKMNDK